MKTSWLVLWVGGLSMACVPPAKNAGEIETSVDPAFDTSGGSSESSTGDGEIPAACLERGWDDSLATFQSMNAAASGTYYYVRGSGGSGLGFEECSYETTIEFAGGVAVRRSLVITELPPVDGWTEADCGLMPYVEEGSAVGSHAGHDNVYPYTMEELYAGCCDLLAIEPAADYEIGFSTDDAGIVSHCYATLADCGEGCEANVDGFSGFGLIAFAFGMQ
jgi:hypothetical protein